MKQVKHKAFAYITRRQHLLVFRHPHAPEAGIQVPAGTIEKGELAEQAVLREAFEETGLVHLTLDRLLGTQTRDMADFGRDEIHVRYFYHLLCDEDTPGSWQHEERFSADGSRHLFEFFWARLPDEVPPLIADHSSMLPCLLSVLAKD